MKLLPIVRRLSGNNYNLHTLVFDVANYTMVDDDLFSLLSQDRWTMNSSGYPWRSKGTDHVFLHMDVVRLRGWPSDVQVDHIYRNKLNNQSWNLRVATKRQNLVNRGLQKNSTTGFRGVSWHKRDRKFVIQGTDAQGKHVYLGRSDVGEEAARIFDDFVLKEFGPYACTNKMLGLIK